MWGLLPRFFDTSRRGVVLCIVTILTLITYRWLSLWRKRTSYNEIYFSPKIGNVWRCFIIDREQFF